MRQAQSASSTAKALLAQRGSGEIAQNDSNEAHDKQVRHVTHNSSYAFEESGL